MIKIRVYCTNPQHPEELCSEVCIALGCKGPRLLCPLCLLDSPTMQRLHDGHETVSLFSLEQRLNETQDEDLEANSPLKLCANIDLTLFQLERDASELKALLSANRCKGFEESYHNYVKHQRSRAFRILELERELSSSGEGNSQIIVLLQELIEIESLLILKDPMVEGVGLAQALLQQLLAELTDIRDSLLGYKKGPTVVSSVREQEILGLFVLNTRRQRLRIRFQEELKSKSIQISSNGQRAEMIEATSQRLVILSPSLKKGGSVVRWGVHIVKLASWIGMGVCHIGQIKEASFCFNYSTLPHGSYLISCNGYSWSSYQQELNSHSGSFAIKQGDKVEIEYSNKESKLCFRHLGTQQTFSMLVKENGDPIHPCINLTGVGDCVEIFDL